MKVVVDPDLCLGCGICEVICPEVFSLRVEPYAVVLLAPVPAQLQAAAKEAIVECPEEAIFIREE